MKQLFFLILIFANNCAASLHQAPGGGIRYRLITPDIKHLQDENEVCKQRMLLQQQENHILSFKLQQARSEKDGNYNPYALVGIGMLAGAFLTIYLASWIDTIA